MSEKGLEKIFIESFQQYGDAIFRFCFIKVSNKELAEDFTQEVFKRYWQSLRAGREMTNTRAFLYTIANNMAKDWYKKKKSESLDRRMDNGYEPRDTHGVSPEENAMYKEALEAIEYMEEADREVLLLRHVEGLDPKDIAEIVGETANAVSVRLTRAMKRLQSKLHYE